MHKNTPRPRFTNLNKIKKELNDHWSTFQDGRWPHGVCWTCGAVAPSLAAALRQSATHPPPPTQSPSRPPPCGTTHATPTTIEPPTLSTSDKRSYRSNNVLAIIGEKLRISHAIDDACDAGVLLLLLLFLYLHHWVRMLLLLLMVEVLIVLEVVQRRRRHLRRRHAFGRRAVRSSRVRRRRRRRRECGVENTRQIIMIIVIVENRLAPSRFHHAVRHYVQFLFPQKQNKKCAQIALSSLTAHVQYQHIFK